MIFKLTSQFSCILFFLVDFGIVTTPFLETQNWKYSRIFRISVDTIFSHQGWKSCDERDNLNTPADADLSWRASVLFRYLKTWPLARGLYPSNTIPSWRQYWIRWFGCWKGWYSTWSVKTAYKTIKSMSWRKFYGIKKVNLSIFAQILA